MILSAPRAARPSEYAARGGEHAFSIPGVFASVGGVSLWRPPSAGARTAMTGHVASLRFAFVGSVPPFVNSRSPLRITLVSPFLVLGDDSFVSIVIGYYPEGR